MNNAEGKSSNCCRKCGQEVWQASQRGAYLKRVSPFGGPFVGECTPSCEHKHGGQNEALLGALEDSSHD